MSEYSRSDKRSLQDVIAKRNHRLEKFFNDLNIPVRIIGNENTPAIIYKEMLCISAYVKNFNLIFTDKSFNGNIVKNIKLTYNPQASREEILDTIRSCSHRAIFNIKVPDEELYLAGYNFVDRKRNSGKYPVFARHNYKIYFSETYASEIVKQFQAEDYNIEIYRPYLNNEENIAYEEYEH